MREFFLSSYMASCYPIHFDELGQLTVSLLRDCFHPTLLEELRFMFKVLPVEQKVKLFAVHHYNPDGTPYRVETGSEYHYTWKSHNICCELVYPTKQLITTGFFSKRTNLVFLRDLCVKTIDKHPDYQKQLHILHLIHLNKHFTINYDSIRWNKVLGDISFDFIDIMSNGNCALIYHSPQAKFEEIAKRNMPVEPITAMETATAPPTDEEQILT